MFDEIDYTTARNWLRRNKEKVKLITGYSLGEYLGCGSYGIVYRASDPRMVVKITTHIDEAHTTAMIMRLRRRGISLPGIVNFKSLVCLRTKGHRNLFFITREYLDEYYDDCLFDLPGVWTGDDVSLGNYRDYLPKIKRQPRLVKTLKTLAKYDVYLWDVREENMGRAILPAPNRKKGDLIIHDVVALTGYLPRIKIKGFAEK